MQDRRFARSGAGQSSQRKQYTHGSPAVYVKAGGREIRLSAQDFNGREEELYVERQYPVCTSCGVAANIGRSDLIPAHKLGSGQTCAGSGIPGNMPNSNPRFWCPSCKNNLLEGGQVDGANSARTYRCPGPECRVRWRTSDEMLANGIGLAML